MSVVDLEKRITSDWTEYNSFLKSSCSLIHVKGDIKLENAGPASMYLTVGDNWYDPSKRKNFSIDERGIRVKEGQSVLIETNQNIAMPYNIFGVIYGTGKNIFKGGFISSGKINPGFQGNLKIGYYNGSDSTIIFKKNDLLACCSFFDMETTMENRLEKYLTVLEPEFEQRTIRHKVICWLSKNWYSLLALLISVMTLIFTILN